MFRVYFLFLFVPISSYLFMFSSFYWYEISKQLMHCTIISYNDQQLHDFIAFLEKNVSIQILDIEISLTPMRNYVHYMELINL